MKIRPARVLFYLLGMTVLALGLTLSAKANLGIAPILSLSFAASEITGLRLGDTTFVLFSLLAVIEIALHLLPGGKRPPASRGKTVLFDLLQVPLALGFTRLVNLFAACLPSPAGIPLRIALLLLSVVLVGSGAAVTMRMRLIPVPADGMVQAASDRFGAEAGLVKNIVDTGCVAMTCLFSLLLAGRVIGVHIGTVIAMLGTGRVIAVFNRLFGRKLCSMAGC